MSDPVISPLEDKAASHESARVLSCIRAAVGAVPNVFRMAAHSPAVLRSLWQQFVASGEMQLPPRLREAVALRVAEIHGCAYCLAAHTESGLRLGLSAEVIGDLRRGHSDDPKEQTILALTTKIVRDRGRNTRFVVEAARQVGVTDVEIVEVIALVGLHTLANYVNDGAGTPLDFPAASPAAVVTP